MNDEPLPERRVAARAILILADAGVIPKNRPMLLRAAHALGLTVPEVEVEIRRMGSKWLPGSGIADREEPAVYGAAAVSRLGVRPRRGGTVTNQRTAEDGSVERRCARCREWFPADVEHFAVKSRASGALTSFCRPCRREYGAARYLRVKSHEALGEVGLEFRSLDGDPTLVCKACGGPIEVGESVSVDGVTCHARCVA